MPASSPSEAAWLVMDASATAPWLVRDEASDAGWALFRAIRDGRWRLILPALWRWEVGNLLLMAQRRGRIDADDRLASLATLEQLPLQFAPPPALEETVQTHAIALDHGLSFYDASYVWLARRRSASLATRDARLRSTASALGIAVVE